MSELVTLKKMVSDLKAAPFLSKGAFVDPILDMTLKVVEDHELRIDRIERLWEIHEGRLDWLTGVADGK